MSDLKIVSFVPALAPAASKFKTGDKVKLKGDTQGMTVRFADKNGVTCEWNSDLGEPQERTYLEDMLESVKPRRRRRVVREIIFTPDPKPKARKTYPMPKRTR